MDNARKKYANIERLSSGDIFALLDSIESDDEGDIENIMNDSDTEFVAESDSVIPTNIIRKEKISDQSSSVSVPEASICILPIQNEVETDTLGQNELNSAPATQRSSNQSPSPTNQRTSNKSPSPANQHTANHSPAAATQRTSNQSPAAATQRTADQSPAVIGTRRTSDQSSKFTPPPTVTLPKNTKKRKQSSMIKDKTKKKKVNAPSDENNTNQKKGSVPQDEDKTKKKKTNTTEEWKWEDKEEPMTKKECTLEAEVLVDLDHDSTPFDIFQTVTGMNELLEVIVTETNSYATQTGRDFETTEDEMKAFLEINVIMGINKLPSLEDYWSTDKYIRNEKIQGVMTRTRFQSILQNLHFSNNDNDNKTDKSYKICPVIGHLNKVFSGSLSNSPFQSVDKHMCKFKGRSSMKQYIKNKSIKWGFKYWYRCDSETGYVYQLEFYQGRKEKRELNLGSSVVLDLCQVLKDTYYHVFSIIFSTVPP